MVRQLEYRKGFLKFQRLGPIEFGKQDRWENAPESKGLWAFPYPHFDLFFAYHKYVDAAPKIFRDRFSSNPTLYINEGGAPVFEIEWREEDGNPIAYGRDSAGNWSEVFFTDEYHAAKEAWVKKVGPKAVAMREFWYNGLLYTRIDSKKHTDNWRLISTGELARLLKKPDTLKTFYKYDASGKPQFIPYSKDHLEVFIPQGKGIMRDKV